MVGALVVVYIFLAGAAWAFITPIGGAPDEPAHIAYSAAVVRGNLGGLATVNHSLYTEMVVVTVPQWVATITDPPRSVEAYTYPCYSFDRSKTADCAPHLSNSTTPTVVPTTVKRYPPPYYWIVGLPTLVMAGEPAVYAMRILSAALVAGMVALGLAIASPLRRTWLALGAMLAATPMVTHLAGSVNPSALEISAALGLSIALMGVAGNDTRRGSTAASIVVLAFAVAWSRPSAHFTLIAVISASMLINGKDLVGWMRPAVRWVTATAGSLAAIGSALAFRSFSTRIGTAAGAPLPVSSRPGAAVNSALLDPRYDLSGNLHELERRSIDWATDLIGRFGWVDHTPPVVVTVAWLLVVMALVTLAVTWAPRRKGASLLVVTAGAVAVAPLFVISTTLNAGVYQARYHLALATLIVISAVTIIDRLPAPGRRRTGWMILRWSAILAPVATALSILGSLQRYAVGGNPHLTDAIRLPFETRFWIPPGYALVVSLTAGIGMLVVGRLLSTTSGGDLRD